ncbi:MAG: RNA polymerase sigma factor [Oscillospiraceae bacterium]|nr:RNA polymerase sigma factor [Oscillospiraceae bacterium]
MDFEEVYKRNVDTVYRVCFGYLKNVQDTQDAVEDTFVKILQKPVKFENAEHEKAFLIKTSANICKNILKHWSRKNENIEDYENLSVNQGFEIDETLQEVLNLSPKLRSAVYLYYYEGYPTKTIAKLLGTTDTAVRMRLSEARKQLKANIEENNRNFELALGVTSEN